MADFNSSKVDGDSVDANEWNQLASIDNFITTSGQTPSTSNLNQMGIGAARYSSGGQFFTDSGTANAYVLTSISPFKSPVSSGAGEGYFIGMEIKFRAGNVNTGASTVNVNSAGVKNLKQADGTTDLAAGDIPTTQDSVFRYNGTAFVLESGSASTTAKGIVELLTNAELAAGTDTSRAATAAAIASLFGTSLRSTNGYFRIPVKEGGAFVEMIMQWGNGTSNNTVTFPIAFPNAVCSVQISGSSSAAVSIFTANGASTSGFTSQAWTDSGVGVTGRTFTWLAIGY
jgi:hypothetical protein